MHECKKKGKIAAAAAADESVRRVCVCLCVFHSVHVIFVWIEVYDCICAVKIRIIRMWLSVKFLHLLLSFNSFGL